MPPSSGIAFEMHVPSEHVLPGAHVGRQRAAALDRRGGAHAAASAMVAINREERMT
jgi:hypothetical protein